MRRFVIASHHLLAYGLKDTLEFLTSKKNIIDISAYIDADEKKLEEVIQEVFSSFGEDDEVFIMTDMLGGSVNQKFYAYMSEYHHLICGINLPCALTLVLQPEDHRMTADQIHNIVEESKTHLIYVNEYKTDDNEDDE